MISTSTVKWRRDSYLRPMKKLETPKTEKLDISKLKQDIKIRKMQSCRGSSPLSNDMFGVSKSLYMTSSNLPNFPYFFSKFDEQTLMPI